MNRFGFEIGTGNDLVAGMKDLLLVVLIHVYFALDDGNARPLGAGADAEDGAGYGNAAIGGGHEEVAGGAVRGLHDNAAAA